MPPSAPIDAQYLTLASNGVLTDYRILDVGSMLVAVDGGPGGNYSLNVDPTAIDHADLDNLTSGDPHTQYMLGTILSANGDILTRVAGSPAALPIGSDGEVLTVNSGLASWAAPASGAFAGYLPPTPTGRYLNPPMMAAAITTNAITANRLYLSAVPIVQTQTFDRIAVNISTGTTGNMRLGIYGPFDGTFASIPLVLDAGTFTTTATGLRSLTISQQLTPGWYLLALVSDATPTLLSRSTASMLPAFGSTDISSGTTDIMSFYAFTYGTLPSPSTAAPSFATTTTPIVALRAA